MRVVPRAGARVVPVASIHTSKAIFDEDHEWKLREADTARRETDPTLYEFGKYVSSILPKYVQQYSVWKDELVLYTAPSGLIPV
ncbi:putative NADH-ubiquinone oxidoreductase 30.4 kDa subunit, mitochondrial, partial [Coemansia sp. RSA 551]